MQRLMIPDRFHTSPENESRFFGDFQERSILEQGKNCWASFMETRSSAETPWVRPPPLPFGLRNKCLENMTPCGEWRTWPSVMMAMQEADVPIHSQIRVWTLWPNSWIGVLCVVQKSYADSLSVQIEMRKHGGHPPWGQIRGGPSPWRKSWICAVSNPDLSFVLNEVLDQRLCHFAAFAKGKN